MLLTTMNLKSLGNILSHRQTIRLWTWSGCEKRHDEIHYTFVDDVTWQVLWPHLLAYTEHIYLQISAFIRVVGAITLDGSGREAQEHACWR
jgi:hypothetical protein